MSVLDVISVNFRSEHVLVGMMRGLSRLAALGFDPHVFITDCSGTATVASARIQSAGARVTVDDPGRNLGFAAGANRAAARGTAPTILFVNPDVIPAPDGIAEIVRLLEADRAGRAVASTGILRNVDGTVQRNTGPPPSITRLALEYLFGIDTRFAPPSSTREVAIITGAVLVVRRSAFEAVGGFDETYPLYVEDVDLCRRLAAHGPLVQAPIEIGVHAGGVSAATAADAAFVLLHASRVAFFRRHRGRLAGWLARTIVMVGCALRVLLRRGVSLSALRPLWLGTAPDSDLRSLLPRRPDGPGPVEGQT